MIDATKIFYFIFGILTIAGGIMGYVKSGSVASVVAGSISGALLLVAGYLLKDKTTAGLILGLVVSLALEARFLPAFVRTHAMMPAGMMSILCTIAIILTALAFTKR